MKKTIKRILAVCAVVILLSLSVIPCFAEEVGFKFTAGQLLSLGQGLDAQKTLAKDPYYILCVTAWDESGADQIQYFVYFANYGTSINLETSTGLTQKGGTLNLLNSVSSVYRAEYNTTATGGYRTKNYVGLGYCTLRSNEIIVAYKNNGWRINNYRVAQDYISSVVEQPNARYAYTSYNQALMGFNGQYENSISASYEEGYAKGYDIGDDTGYKTGYKQATEYFDRVITSREEQAFDSGYTVGYSVGFSEGVGGEVKAYELRIDKIITAIPEAVRTIIDGSLDGLSVGGIALSSFAIGVLILGLVVTVVLWLWKVFK